MGLSTEALSADVVPASVFETNPDRNVAVRHVGRGGHRVVVVDDFYAHPERVCDAVEQLHYFPDVGEDVALPVVRALAHADLSEIEPIVRAYARQDHLIDGTDFCLEIQAMWGNTPLSDRQRLPHNDPTAAAFVYLNRPEDCAGGTGLYRHRPTGLELVPLRPDSKMVELARDLGYPPIRVGTRSRNYVDMVRRVVYDTSQANEDGTLLNDGNRYWELIDLIEMRFNRLVVYDARMPHTAYIPSGAFEEVPRILQMLSIQFDEHIIGHFT